MYNVKSTQNKCNFSEIYYKAILQKNNCRVFLKKKERKRVSVTHDASLLKILNKDITGWRTDSQGVPILR